MQPSPAAVRYVQELAAAALRLEAGAGPRAEQARPGALVDQVPADDLAAAASRHRVTELLHSQIDALGLEERQGVGFVAWLARAHADACRGVTVQLLELRRVLDAFADAGVPVLVLKGPALAMQSAGEVTARGYGDVDLFVSPESVEAASTLLAEAGWHPRPIGSAPPGTWAWRHVIRTYNETTFDGRASTVDLHWRLDPTPDTLPCFDSSWERRAVVEVGDLAIPTLGLSDAFAHSCLHAAKDQWRWLRSLVDVHRLARSPELRSEDWSEVTAHRHGGRHVLSTLAVTEQLLGLADTVPSTVRGRLADHGRAVQRARTTQEQPPSVVSPFLAAQSARNLRYRLEASRSPRALALAVVATAFPAQSVADIEDRTAWTAVPRLVVRRLRRLGSRSRDWIVEWFAARRAEVPPSSAHPQGAPSSRVPGGRS